MFNMQTIAALVADGHAFVMGIDLVFVGRPLRIGLERQVGKRVKLECGGQV